MASSAHINKLENSILHKSYTFLWDYSVNNEKCVEIFHVHSDLYQNRYSKQWSWWWLMVLFLWNTEICLRLIGLCSKLSCEKKLRWWRFMSTVGILIYLGVPPHAYQMSYSFVGWLGLDAYITCKFGYNCINAFKRYGNLFQHYSQ